MKHGTIKSVCALLLACGLFLLTNGRTSIQPYPYSCGCEDCRCASADRVFHIKTSDIINIRIENLDMRTLAILAHDSPEENQVVDLLNNFTPEKICPAKRRNMN